MNNKITFLLCLLLMLTINGIFAQGGVSVNSTQNNSQENEETVIEEEKHNYLGITPTFILMGMYGIVYGRAINENVFLGGAAGYTNFDLSPFPFLANEDWLYQNAYMGAVLCIYPFSTEIFPCGFYCGMDFVPSIGFWQQRNSGETGTGVGLTSDLIAGYSWILAECIKLSADVFLSFNMPEIHISGSYPKADWTIFPFFDINLGLIF